MADKIRKMDDNTFNELFREGELDLIMLDGGENLTPQQLKKVKEYGRIQYELKLQEMGAKVASQPGYKEFMMMPLISSIMKQSFAGQSKKSTQQVPTAPTVSPPKAKKISKKKNKKNDPNHSTLGKAPIQNLRIGDSEADLLARMFTLQKAEDAFYKKQEKIDAKYRKRVDKDKDRRLEEVISALNGKKPSKIKGVIRKASDSGLLKYGLIGAAAVGGLLVSRKAFANINLDTIFNDLPKYENPDEIQKSFPIFNLHKTETSPKNISDFTGLIGREAAGFDTLVMTSGPKVSTDKKLTEMKVSEVYKLQDEMIKKGYPSTAVGKFQITKGTLQGWMKQEGLDPEKTVYNEETQKRLMMRGVKNAGLEKYQKGEMSAEDFQIGLAKTWAAIPVPRDMEVRDEFGYRKLKKGQSYYAGVGKNAAYIAQADVSKVIEGAKSTSMANLPSGDDVIAIGDSLAVGVNGALGVKDANKLSKVGDSPSAVLKKIQDIEKENPGYFKGKKVVLGSGAPNTGGNLDSTQVDLINQQITLLKSLGAIPVLLGTGPGAPEKGVHTEGMNDKLKALASSQGIPFLNIANMFDIKKMDPAMGLHLSPDAYKKVSEMIKSGNINLAALQNEVPDLKLASNSPTKNRGGVNNTVITTVVQGSTTVALNNNPYESNRPIMYDVQYGSVT